MIEYLSRLFADLKEESGQTMAEYAVVLGVITIAVVVTLGLLSTKISAVLDARAGTPLLDTYRAEREPVGRRNVAETRAAWLAMRNPSGPQFAGRSLRQIA